MRINRQSSRRSVFPCWLSALTAAALPAILLAAGPSIGRAQPKPGAPASPAPVAPGGGAGAVAPAGAVAGPISPYVDDSTLLVAEIDPGRIDWEAWNNWLGDMLRAAKAAPKDLDAFFAETKRQLPLVKKWTADFTRAGGKKVYLIGRLNQEAPFYAVVPLGAGADAKAIGELLKDPLNMAAANAANAAAGPQGQGAPGAPAGEAPLAGMKAEVVGNALYFGPEAAIADAKNFTAAARPELEQAFASSAGVPGAAAADAGGAPLRIAFNPSEGLRGVMILSKKNLPDELGGGPVGPVATGFRWASLSVRMPTAAAKPSLQLTVQAKDAAAAKTLSGIVDALHKTAAAAQQPGGPAGMRIDWLFDALSPRIAADKADQLRLSLDDAKLKDLVARLVPALEAARRQATVVKSMNNEKQIALAMMMYANENKGRLPKDLPADIKEFFPGGALHDVFTNPARPEAEGGYVYAPPAETITAVRNSADTPVLWEAFSPDQWGEGVNVAFMDGHVEHVKDKAQFDKFLKNNPNAAKAQPVKVGPAKEGKESKESKQDK